MRTAYIKENLRKISKTKTRFISLVLIVTLGVLFFTGMNSVSPDMEKTMNEYLKEYNVTDIQILSELGFTDEDISVIKNIENVVEVIPSHIYDVILEKDGKRMPVRTNSINIEQNVNKVQILEGRYIKKQNECLIDERLVDEHNYKIGDVITLKSGNDDDINEELTNISFTIVGKIRTPTYISKYYGSTELENGELLGCIYILDTVYKSDIYTNVYVKTDIPNDIAKLSDEYKQKLEKIVEKVEKLGTDRATIRYNDVYNENYEDVLEAKNKIADAKSELKDAKEELNNAKNTLNDLSHQIYTGRITLDSTKVSTQELFKNYYNTLQSAKEKIENNSEKLENVQKQIEVAKQELENAKLEYSNNETELNNLNNQIEQLIYLLSNMDKTTGEYAILNRKIMYLEEIYKNRLTHLSNAKEKIDIADKELSAKIAEINESSQRLDIAKLEYEYGNDEYEKQLIQYNTEVNKSENSINYYVKLLEDGRKTYFINLSQYNEEKEKADKEIAEKEQEIQDAENKLEKLSGKWYVIGLYDNEGFKAFKNDLEKVGIMGKVFPVMFFIVAALVSITTITRMIEEDRGTIATEKALGYSKATIISKYVLYSMSAAIIGIAIGTLIGSYIITGVLYNAYRILYASPDLIMEINPICLGIAILITFASTVLCAIVITWKELNCKTAELMRPKAPKEGKEIFLEKCRGFWERLSFLLKVSIRNIFRYKRRLFMAVIGIAGCTALIYTGLSLKESVDKIAIKQYGEIKSYDMQVNLDYEMSFEDLKETLESVKETDKITSATYVREKSTDIEANGISKNIFYLVGEPQEISNYIKLQNRKTKKNLMLSENGVIISEKLANTLKVKVGDIVTIGENAHKSDAIITGITENYLFNYLYMTPSLYESIFDEEIMYNEILANTEELTEEQEKELASTLKENSKISGISLIRVINEEYKKSLESLMSIVFLCIGCASLLSFIVLFNLNSINIEERKRELATIKVLGFYDKEVSSYVFRENLILTVLGGIAGLFLGTVILGPIMKSGEVETIYLPVELNWITFVISFAITMIFTLITNKIMNKRLKKIDMIDSLKSIE